MAFSRTSHEQKYDRQMRLWGGHGQQRIEQAHVACIGSGPTASETIKNLVLPSKEEERQVCARVCVHDGRTAKMKGRNPTAL